MPCSNANTVAVYYGQNEHSNPWRLASGGTLHTSGDFFYETDVSGAGFLGDAHNRVGGIDLSFLGGMQEFTAHFTMGCGNDNLMGSSTTAPVPEPSSIILFSIGLGLIAFRRKFA